MSDGNVCSFTGILGKDPEFRAEANWQKLSFSIANNTGWGDKKKTEWIKVTMWGKRAEVMSRFLRAKYKVFVSGVGTTRAYIDRDGKPRSSLELDCRECEILSQSSRGASGGGSDPDGDATAAPEQQRTSQPPIDDDGIPF